MSWRATVESTVLARRNARLVATLWLFNLALAFAGALPGWMTLSSLMGSLPAADALGAAFHFGVLSDLSELQPGLVSGFGRAALAALALGLVVALATTGGTLEVLTSGDERSFAHRFGRGAGRFFLRFLRLGLITLVTAPIVTGLSAAPLLALSRQLRRESGSEWLAVSMWLLAVAVAGLVLLFVLLVQDAARVLLVRDDERRVRRVLRPALATVLRHPLKWLSVWSWNAVLLLVLFAVYLALSNAVPPAKLLVVLVLLQQAFVLLRCGLRVALLGAEVELVAALRPRPPAPPAAAAPPQAEPELPEPPSEPEPEGGAPVGLA
jgi:hypothetical protein